MRGVLAASAAAKMYERSDWNDVSASGDIGLTRLTDRGSVSGGLRLGRRWVGGDAYNRTLGPWAQARVRLSSSTRLGLAVERGVPGARRKDRARRVAHRAHASPRAPAGQPDVDQSGADVRDRRGEDGPPRKPLDRPGSDDCANVRRRAVGIALARHPRPSIRLGGSPLWNQADRQDLPARSKGCCTGLCDTPDSPPGSAIPSNGTGPASRYTTTGTTA